MCGMCDETIDEYAKSEASLRDRLEWAVIALTQIKYMGQVELEEGRPLRVAEAALRRIDAAAKK